MVSRMQRYFIWAIAGIFALWVTTGPHFLQQVIAEPDFVDVSLSLVTYNPPNRGAPGETGDGGTRGCPGIIALQDSDSNWGETTAAHPTFWAYLSGTTESVTLALSDENSGQAVYETTFIPAPGEGLGRYTLPYDAPSLAVDTPYRWQMTINCPTEDGPPSVNGVIVRRAVSASLQAELNEASPRDRVVLLSAQGLWYDALDEIAELRLANGTDEALAADWIGLVKHVEPLADTADGLVQPIIGPYPQRR